MSWKLDWLIGPRGAFSYHTAISSKIPRSASERVADYFSPSEEITPQSLPVWGLLGFHVCASVLGIAD